MKLKKREQEVIVAIKYAKQLRNERECPCPLSAKFWCVWIYTYRCQYEKKINRGSTLFLS